MKRILAIVALLTVALGALADNVTFVARAPRVVAVGEQFQLKFDVNVMPDDFYNPDIKNFEVLAGPNMSQFQSTTIVNGQVSSKNSISYTYILEATREGKFSIPAAVVKINGRTYTSNSLVIEVVKGDASASSRGSAGSVRAPKGASNGSVFLRMEVNKSSLYRGEYLIATLKLYTRADLEGLGEPKFPSFNGFWNQVVEDNDLRLNFVREKYNNKVYDAAVIRRYVLFPQQVGKLVVDPFELTASIVEHTAPQSAFDAFFGGGGTRARKRLASAPISINVKELPTGAPSSFNGAVGSFTVTASLSKNKVRANDAVNLVVKVSGSGNVKLVEALKVNFPADFDTFDPKVSDNVKTTAAGSYGVKVFEYSFIPRSQGKYTIPALEFSYFDTKTNRYKTVKTQSQTIDVAPDPTGGARNGLQGGADKESIKLLGQDIKYIKVGSTILTPKGDYFFNTATYWLVLLLAFVAIVASFMFLAKRERENADVAFIKNKRANKVAYQRLKKAEVLIKSGDTHGFYEEMLKALWGYLSDKLAIPVSDLSKERAAQLLVSKGADGETIKTLTQIIEECEFARYAPGGQGEEKSDRFNHAVEIISKLEQLKK
ncbi:BatD family protein [Acetobacteroides hydrogenigenes]|uniref:Oxygen tolerance protein BatD n=1 Tax=Acetobacteroides hydrogenigenes TaxID=979970 RepID=A0A4R2E859_9BACT|nr:BatD family protein [Acetobacteroides hydrogenigenes]TCN62722.1 oxygen tolerance protein BatD [Acetobacteroides hydrogenigenes]